MGLHEELECDQCAVNGSEIDQAPQRRGEDTVFFHKGSHIPANKIEAFKRRRKIKDSDLGSPRACVDILLGR